MARSQGTRRGWGCCPDSMPCGGRVPRVMLGTCLRQKMMENVSAWKTEEKAKKVNCRRESMFWEQLYFHSCNRVGFFIGFLWFFFGETVSGLYLPCNDVTYFWFPKYLLCVCASIYTLICTHTAYTQHIYTLTHGCAELKSYVDA